MRPWLLPAFGFCLLAAGCRRTPPAEDLLAFVPEDAFLLATLESVESIEEDVEDLKAFLGKPRPRPGSHVLSLLAEEAGFENPDVIDATAPVGLVLLEENSRLVPVYLLPLKAGGTSGKSALRTRSGDSLAMHGRVAVLSASEGAVRRCAPREASSKLAPKLDGAIHVVVDAGRLVDRYRHEIDARLRSLEQLFVELPRTVSPGSKVPPPPMVEISEAFFRGARHAIFGTERAELALDLRGGRLRLQAGARVREGSRAEAALSRLPAGPILLDLLPEARDIVFQYAMPKGATPAFVLPMFDWMVDGLEEPSRSELRGAWERMGSVAGVGVGTARIGPDGSDLLAILRSEDPQGAFRAGQEYWNKLASLAEFFRKAEEAPFRFEVGEPVRWEHAGHVVEERRYVPMARDEDSPTGGMLGMWFGENSTICSAVVQDLVLTAMGPRSGEWMRRAVDQVASGSRRASPPPIREWLARIPEEVSFLCAMDVAALLRAPFLPEPPPFPPPDRPIWLFLDFTARGREARAGLEIDLRGFLEAARPR